MSSLSNVQIFFAGMMSMSSHVADFRKHVSRFHSDLSTYTNVTHPLSLLHRTAQPCRTKKNRNLVNHHDLQIYVFRKANFKSHSVFGPLPYPFYLFVCTI